MIQKLLFSLLCFQMFGLQAQQKTISLWNSEQSAEEPNLNLYPATNGNGAAVVICPGGGYGQLARDHEGHQVAKWFNDRGVSAFVLHYRLGKQGHHFPAQLADVQRAIRIVRNLAQEGEIDPNRIGVLGFSAGGHLASMAATKFDEKAYDPIDEIDQTRARPDFAVLCYPVISSDSEFTHKGSIRNLLGPDKKDDSAAKLHISSDKNINASTPPTFLFHTDEDSAVPPENSILFYLALRKHKIPAELHLFQRGPHGVGLFEGDPILGKWSDHLEDWLRSNEFFAKDVKRAEVSGFVTLNGIPVHWGTVTFHPENKNLPVVTHRIRRGKFSSKSVDGPVVGKSLVTFSGSVWEETRNDTDRLVKKEIEKPVTVVDGAKFEWEFRE